MINLELRRALYKAFGIRPDGLQRVIIDIQPDAEPVLYYTAKTTGATVEEILDAVVFERATIRKVDILESQPVEGVQLTTDDGVSVWGIAIVHPHCTNDVRCTVQELHLHANK